MIEIKFIVLAIAAVPLAFLIAMAAASGWYSVKHKRQAEFIRQIEKEH